MADDVLYQSKVSVERINGPLRKMYLPLISEPLLIGLHSEVAERYGLDTSVHEPHTMTLDYLVAATAGCLTGTFGGALEARDIPAGEGRLRSEAIGNVVEEDNVLVVSSIHVQYWLKLDPDKHQAAERAHEVHANHCAVARSINRCVNITTSLNMEEL